MEYEKQTWRNGDVITAAKLNNMEDGIETAIENALSVRVDGTRLIFVPQTDSNNE